MKYSKVTKKEWRYVDKQTYILAKEGWQVKIESGYGCTRGRIVVLQSYRYEPYYVCKTIKQFQKLMRKWHKGKLK
jgi:hypothetical protein